MSQSGVAQACDLGDRCVTCSDEGRPGVVVSWPGDTAMTPELSLGGIVRTEQGDECVDLSMVPGVMVGDRVLIHGGVAIAALGPEA